MVNWRFKQQVSIITTWTCATDHFKLNMQHLRKKIKKPGNVSTRYEILPGDMKESDFEEEDRKET